MISNPQPYNTRKRRRFAKPIACAVVLALLTVFAFVKNNGPSFTTMFRDTEEELEFAKKTFDENKHNPDIEADMLIPVIPDIYCEEYVIKDGTEDGSEDGSEDGTKDGKKVKCKTQRNVGIQYLLFFLYFIVSVYCFGWMGIVADEYLMPALEVIAYCWGMSPVFAGVTLMALGGSFPELCITVICTIKDSMGDGEDSEPDESALGCVIGSAVFNLLLIQFACSMVADVRVTSWDVCRDTIWNTLAVLMFWGLSLMAKHNDVKIGDNVKGFKVFSCTEAAIMNAFYVIYVLVMCFDTQLRTYFGFPAAQGEEDDEDATIVVEQKTGPAPIPLSELTHSRMHSHLPGRQALTKTIQGDQQNEEDVEEEDQGALCDFFHLILCPILFFMNLLPDCSDKKTTGQCSAWVTFLGSCISILFACVIVGDLLARIGEFLYITSYFMGLSVIAIGTSIPDTFASMYCAKAGFGDMAICSGIGSNTFNIVVVFPFAMYVEYILAAAKGDTDDCGMEFKEAAFPLLIIVITAVNSWNLISIGLCKWSIPSWLGGIDGCLWLAYIAIEFCNLIG